MSDRDSDRTHVSGGEPAGAEPPAETTEDTANGNGARPDASPNPFAGLSIDFGAAAADAVALPGANGGASIAASIAFGPPLAATERSRPAGPVGGPDDGAEDENRTKLLIIGSGPAGLTAAIYASR